MQSPVRSGRPTSTALAVRPASVVRAPGRDIEALTAAAIRVNRRSAGDMRRLIQPWQQRALAYYDIVGECWNSAQFYSRSLKQVRLFVAERGEDGELEETEDPEALDQLARIQDPGGGGYTRLLDAYGRLWFLCGEGYYLITNPDGEDESWEFVSSDELRLNGAGEYTRFAAPSLPAQMLRDVPDAAYQPIGDEALVFRVWRPHPRYSALADSPVRAVLDLLEELVLLTLAVRARAKSRLAANGILVIPDELSPTPPGTIGDEDPLADPFLEDIIEQIVTPIENPGTAAAVAPAMIRGASEYIEKIKLIQISNPLETYPEQGLRTEAVRRYAIGIEMPAEILTGTADVNHWGAWLIDEQGAKQYIFPVCQTLVDDLTSVFLRPTMRATGRADWDRFVFGFDASAVVAHPDRTKDAKDLHGMLVISDEALREAANFNDGDAPDEAEYDRRVGVQLKDATLATEGRYEVQSTPLINEDDEQTDEEGAPQSGAEVDAAAPEGIPADEALIAQNRVQGFMAAAILRARQLAGGRLRGVLQHADAESFKISLTAEDELAGIPNDRLAEALGQEWVQAHAGRNEQMLVQGATAGMPDILRSWGVAPEAAEQLCSLVSQHAARTLYSTATDLPKPLRNLIVQATR